MKRTWVTILSILSEILRIILNKTDKPKKDEESVG